MKERTWIRNTLFIISQPFLPPVGILPTIIHEAAHYFTAILIGVPKSDIDFKFYLMNPGVSIPKTIHPDLIPYFFYSGGITSGVILLMFYIFYWVNKYYHHPSTTNWIMSMLIVFSVTIQLYIGILEGIYHESYGSNINTYFLVMFIVIALIFHIIIFHLVKRYKIKRNSNRI